MDNYSTTATTGSEELLTLGKLMESMREMERVLGPDPLKEFMMRQGFDPDKGAKLVLPIKMLKEFGAFGAPDYVMFTEISESALIIWPGHKPHYKKFTGVIDLEVTS